MSKKEDIINKELKEKSKKVKTEIEIIEEDIVADEEKKSVTKESEPQNVREINTSTGKKANFQDDKEKIYVPIIKKIIHGWFFLRLMGKAKKMANSKKTDPNKYSEQYRYTWIRKKALKILKILNIRINVFGIQNWLDQGIVLAPNHKSNFDPLILLALNDFEVQQVIAFLAKKELWASKMGRFVSIIDSVPIDRNNPRSAHEAFQAAKKLIVNYKRAMVVFPEGTRFVDEKIHEFIPTSLRLPQMANVPIVPVSIINTQTLQEKTKKEKVITVVFDKPVLHDKHIIMKPEVLSSIIQRKVEENYNKYKEINISDLQPVSKQKRRKIFYFDLV